jgi:hypothetical protein
MSDPTVRPESGLRYGLVLDGISYGLFKGPEIELGSEVKEDWDPEYGPLLVGGKKTGDDLKLERIWLPIRDDANYQYLEPRRGRLNGTAPLFRVDEDGQPTTTTPLTIHKVRFMAVTTPAASDSGDSGKFIVTVKVRG